ncbi:MSHA biogenesis protein MshP [Vibrio sp. S4M6]|uniref:MSHA biogenesis protein MshP n=1 Tax=Vibrio sinus TaxID=2946865 RepID=UPI00202A6D3A|nr:MSHA biogenesis protein MshP [Vibrio sinus]MCL9780535.1 MSHA biogenesis protein MshP [Vibrio sinus]
MFPNQKAYSISKQQGNLYIIAVFVLVVMGFLGANLARIEYSNRDAITRDVLGTQAWLLAHSANEYVLTQLYPIDASAAVAANCDPIAAAITTGANTMRSSYFNNCASVTVACTSIGTLDSVNYYKVESSAICGSGINEVERTQEVWVRE